MKSSTGLKLEKVVNYFRKSFVLDVRLDFKYAFKWFCTRCSTKGTIEIVPFVKCCITNKVVLGSVTNTLVKSQIFAEVFLIEGYEFAGCSAKEVSHCSFRTLRKPC